MEYCVQGSSWLLYITEDIFLGPDGFLGMLAPKRYVHDGCHGHSSKFSLVSLCSHHGHTLAHTVCKVQAGFCTSQDIFLGPDGFLGMLAPKRYVHDGCHGHSSKFSLVSLCSHHGHTLAHTIAHISNDTTLPSPAGFILGG